MIKIDNEEVFNFEGAIRGMRNPLESWDKSDSLNSFLCEDSKFHIGKNDLDLMQRLITAGSDHSKFMRQILVSVDITAPLYWWKEYDTYKIGTVANSTSTMHTICKKEITRDMFSIDNNLPKDVEFCGIWNISINDNLIPYLNYLREQYLNTKDKSYWRALIQLLPSGFNQTRTCILNYAVLRNMYFSRKNHKLDEWQEFCKWIERLLYGRELICYKNTEEKDAN